jgi:hypothetical protein
VGKMLIGGQEFTLHGSTDDPPQTIELCLRGFVYTAQIAVEQTLKQKSGCVVSITAALTHNPIAGVNAPVSMIMKGDLNTVVRSLAIEYAKEGPLQRRSPRCSRHIPSQE